MPWSGDIFSGQDVLGDPNAPLVGPDDFAEWYGISAPSNDELNRIQTACEIASAQVRLGRRMFTPVTNDVVLVDGSHSQTLLLPKNRLPVTGVTQVDEFSGTTYTTLDATSYAWSADGILTRLYGGWTGLPQGVRVTYSHGYAALPRDVAGVCLSLAGRLYTNPDNSTIQSEQLGDHHVTFTGSTGGLSPAEETVLRMYESIA